MEIQFLYEIVKSKGLFIYRMVTPTVCSLKKVMYEWKLTVSFSYEKKYRKLCHRYEICLFFFVAENNAKLF